MALSASVVTGLQRLLGPGGVVLTPEGRLTYESDMLTLYKGMPDVVSGRSRGDLLITVKLVTPKKVTREQRKLLEQLAAMLPEEKFEPTSRDDHEDRGLFDRVKDIFG